MEEKKEFKKDQKRKDNKKPFKKAPTKTLDEIIVETKAVVKVTKGGRQRRFQAVVLVGDKKGLVGLGTGKAAEVSEAVKKARQDANKNVVRIPIIDGRTIPHEVVGIKGATRVIIKPAKEGTGVIAGGPARAVLELAGLKDVRAKSLGSNNPRNMVNATINGLASLRTAEDIAKLRGKTVEEILG